jgi:hypothetical protein
MANAGRFVKYFEAGNRGFLSRRGLRVRVCLSDYKGIPYGFFRVLLI